MSAARLTVALGEYDTGWHAPAESLKSAAGLVGRAAGLGAKLVVLPEMATTGFTMDTTKAVLVGSSDVKALRAMARKHGVWLIAGVALREEEGGANACAVNAALAIDPSGEIAAVHRKRRLFAYGKEDASYTPGREPTIVDVDGVRVGLFVCYELRFPELFREVATEVDAMVLIANWPTARQEHWEALLPARAIENQCIVIGVNRLGTAGGHQYAGGSMAIDAWGHRLPVVMSDEVRLVSLDTAPVHEIRARYPFLPSS